MKEFLVFVLGIAIISCIGSLFPAPFDSLVAFVLGVLWGHIWGHKYVLKDL